MRMFIRNLDTRQYSTDIINAEGEQIRLLIQPGAVGLVENVDPFYVNQDQIHRLEEFRDYQLHVWFECEDDDWIAYNAKICLPGGVATKGQILVADANGVFRPTGPGADGDVVIWDASQPYGVRFGAAPSGGNPSPIEFGADSVGSSPTTRYLYPGNAERIAEVSPYFWTAPRAGTLQNLFVRHNIPAGNGNSIVYRVRVNTIATGLLVTLASTGTVASNILTTIAVVQGDRVDLQVVKTLNIGASPRNVLATMEVA